jgi:uncharacterized membrane protein
MNDTVPSHVEIENFLRAFRQGLVAVPADIRDDLVKEMRSHLEERLERGQLRLANEFGSPEEYASQFVHEQLLGTAIVRARPWELLLALLGAIRTASVAICFVLPLAVVELIGLALVLIGLSKPLASTHIGFFKLADGSFGGLGWISNTTSMHELLGFTAIPLFIFLGLLLFWAGNRIMLTVARGELARIRNQRRNSMTSGSK